MRIRTIKPEFFTHEGIFETEAETGLPIRIAFAGLWCAADREGRFKWEPRRLGVQILPYDQVDFSRVLDALTTRGFIVRYASDTGDFGVIPSFLRHQVINNRERTSELPDPNDCKAFDASTTREARVDHAEKAEGKGRERKGKEGNLCPQADVLAEIWNLCPSLGKSRSSKKQVADAWKSIPAKERPSSDVLLISFNKWITSQDWAKDNGQYVPALHLWFKNRKWEVEPIPMVEAKPERRDIDGFGV